MDVVKRTKLLDAVDRMTKSGSVTLDATDLQEVKAIVRQSSQYLHCLFEVLFQKKLSYAHSQVRYSALLLTAEIFARSAEFRRLVVHHFEKFLQCTVGIADHVLPPPESFARLMHDKALEFVEGWSTKFGHNYRELQLAHTYLKTNLRKPFPEVERRARDEARSKEIARRERMCKVRREVEEELGPIEALLEQLDSCFEVLVPDDLGITRSAAKPSTTSTLAKPSTTAASAKPSASSSSSAKLPTSIKSLPTSASAAEPPIACNDVEMEDEMAAAIRLSMGNGTPMQNGGGSDKPSTSALTNAAQSKLRELFGSDTDDDHDEHHLEHQRDCRDEDIDDDEVDVGAVYGDAYDPQEEADVSTRSSAARHGLGHSAYHIEVSVGAPGSVAAAGDAALLDSVADYHRELDRNMRPRLVRWMEIVTTNRDETNRDRSLLQKLIDTKEWPATETLPPTLTPHCPCCGTLLPPHPVASSAPLWHC